MNKLSIAMSPKAGLLKLRKLLVCPENEPAGIQNVEANLNTWLWRWYAHPRSTLVASVRF